MDSELKSFTQANESTSTKQSVLAEETCTEDQIDIFALGDLDIPDTMKNYDY